MQPKSLTLSAVHGSDKIVAEMLGNKFYRLTVKAFAGYDKARKMLLCCECECGVEKIIRANAVRTGEIRSCGCLMRAASAEAHWLHGETFSPEHRAYCAMHQRCRDPQTNVYDRYGGRGIKVCPRWRGPEGFIWFLVDMGPKPEPTRHYTIERLDVNGDYEPGNCIWATTKQQGRNQRSNRMLTNNGETHCIAEWEELRGWQPGSLKSRIARGWDVERALNTPMGGHGSNGSKVVSANKQLSLDTAAASA